MGGKQFTTAVRGSKGDPVTMTQAGSFEVDNYQNVEGVSGSAYPLSADPAISVQEMVMTQNPGDKTLDITTTSGDTLTGFPLGGGALALNTLSVESITVNDPNATGGTTSIILIGE